MYLTFSKKYQFNQVVNPHWKICKLIILILFACQFVHAQELPDSIYRRKDFLMMKAQQEELTTYEQKELVHIAFTFQNKGFLLDEQVGDFANALAYIDYAIPIWQSLKNISMEANLHKFKGQLLGKLYQFPEAKLSIQHAITQYESINQPSGIAVSYFDLAIVYNFQHKTDSARIYLEGANAYWLETANTSRIIGLYLYDVYLDLREEKYETARVKLYKFEANYSLSEIIDWDQISYYYLMFILAKKTNRNMEPETYFEKYKELSERLNIDLSKQFIMD
jgi:hypothetical protein